VLQPALGHAHTVTLVDELLACTEQLCCPLERSALLRQALAQRESAKRLAALCCSDPGLDPVRGPPTNRAFSRYLITCSFSISSRPATRQPANRLMLPANERSLVGIGYRLIRL